MEMNDLIKVLWVEDDPEVTNTYPLEAENYDLELVPVCCWDDAKVELENKFHQWSAIILDAKCKYHRGSEDNAIVFLREALDDISTICQREGRIIPWYILTGGDKFDVSDSINDKRLKWDKDWTDKEKKKYYSKDIDRETLYARIKSHAKKSTNIQIHEMYRDTFKQLYSLNNDEICEDIATIFETMHYPTAHQDFTARLYYNPMRKALESVFRLAGRYGVIPDEFFAGGKVNLNQCFMFLIGRDADVIGYRYGNKGEQIVPRHINDMMSLIINLGNCNSHTVDTSHSTLLSDEEVLRYDEHIKSQGVSSRLLLFSIALQFCEIVKWMNSYVAKNPKREDNLRKCVKLQEKSPEVLRGKISSDKTKITSISKYIVDRSNGFQKGFSPNNYEYKDKEDVMFELKKTTNPKTGLSYSFATNVRPIGIE